MGEPDSAQAIGNKTSSQSEAGGAISHQWKTKGDFKFYPVHGEKHMN